MKSLQFVPAIMALVLASKEGEKTVVSVIETEKTFNENFKVISLLGRGTTNMPVKVVEKAQESAKAKKFKDPYQQVKTRLVNNLFNKWTVTGMQEKDPVKIEVEGVICYSVIEDKGDTFTLKVYSFVENTVVNGKTTPVWSKEPIYSEEYDKGQTIDPYSPKFDNIRDFVFTYDFNALNWKKIMEIRVMPVLLGDSVIVKAFKAAEKMNRIIAAAADKLENLGNEEFEQDMEETLRQLKKENPMDKLEVFVAKSNSEIAAEQASQKGQVEKFNEKYGKKAEVVEQLPAPAEEILVEIVEEAPKKAKKTGKKKAAVEIAE